MSVPELIGWELLYKLIENNLRSESDIIIAIAHWFLIKEGIFRCIGVGDKKTLSENEESSELLPDHWNNNSLSYSLRYVNDGRVYILLGTVVNDTIILNLLNGDSLEVANMALNINDTVKSLKGSLTVLVPDIKYILSRIKKELVEPVKALIESTRSTETQTSTTEETSHGPSRRSPLDFYRSPQFPILPDPLRDIGRGDRNPLRDIGRGDLDPLGRGGGGMLFNPPGMPFQPPLPGVPGRNPLPGVIPGARFDPFGPPEPGRIGRMGPDPDHFPPPGYDDMFM